MEEGNEDQKRADHSLFLVAQMGSAAAARKLIEDGANMSAVDRDDRTPLHWAAICRNIDVADVLIQCGANVHALDNDGRTPLHLAALVGNYYGVKALLREGCDPVRLDNDWMTPEDLSRANSHTVTAELIRESARRQGKLR